MSSRRHSPALTPRMIAPETIFVVDDETESLTGIHYFLMELGYRVEAFSSARSALDALEDTPCDLLLTDLLMPEMNGIALMKEVRAFDPLMICIMITGHGTIETAIEAMREGAFDFITKPVDWKMLRLSISRALSIRRLLQSEEELRISRDLSRTFARRLAEAQEHERKRIARELHDGVSQNIVALDLNLYSLHMLFTDGLTREANKTLTEARAILSEITEAIRNVVFDLRPAVLDDFGLLAALKSQSDTFSQRTGIDISVGGDDEMPRLPNFSEITLYRIAQEALTNVAKHANARHVSVSLVRNAVGLRLEIADDGIGFDSADFDVPKRDGNWGMLNMRERAEAIGGRLFVTSAPGNGTRVIVEIPNEHLDAPQRP